MDFPRAREVVERLVVLQEIGSTNAELVARASAGTEPDLSVLVTTSQTAGKGRLGRVWVAPPGKTIAVSVLLATGTQAPERLGWLPLLAGLAMTRAVGSLVTEHEVTLKWPNDVQVDGFKISGLLAELVPGVGVVIGAGLNVSMTSDELPTATSTSLALVGSAADVDTALAAYLAELAALYSTFVAANLDPVSSGLHAAVTAECSSIGRAVRVELPGDGELLGTATGIDLLGRLLVDGTAVAAGDVTHLRYR